LVLTDGQAGASEHDRFAHPVLRCGEVRTAEAFAVVLKDYSKDDKLNQADLAQLLNLGQSYVSKIETGQRQVRDLDTLLRIANQLNISPTRLGLANCSPHPRRSSPSPTPETSAKT
jgi:predicted transcriptional regulator